MNKIRVTSSMLLLIALNACSSLGSSQAPGLQAQPGSPPATPAQAASTQDAPRPWGYHSYPFGQ